MSADPRTLADRLDQARTAHLRWPDSTPDDDTLDDLRAAAVLLRRHADLVDRIADAVDGST